MDAESNDDLCYLEVQRLRAMGLSWKDTPFVGYLADRVKCVWDVLQDGFNRGYWDFMYLLEASAKKGLTFKADYVAVDEINDLTPLQCRIVGRSEGAKVVFCGDLDQTIHGWAGSSPEAVLALPHDKVEYQNESYRLTDEVTEYAERILRYKKIKPLAGKGEVTRDMNFRNVLRDLRGDALVLGRTNYIVQCARREALQVGANVVMSDEEALQAELVALIKDLPPTFSFNKAESILGAWLPAGRFWRWGAKKKLREHMERSPFHNMSWSRLYEEFGTPDLKRVIEGNLGWYEGRPNFDPAKPLIRFSTIHAAKGAEEETVVVLRDLDARVREGLWRNEEEERRVAYVAATRAKRHLIISSLGGARESPYLA